MKKTWIVIPCDVFILGVRSRGSSWGPKFCKKKKIHSACMYLRISNKIGNILSIFLGNWNIQYTATLTISYCCFFVEGANHPHLSIALVPKRCHLSNFSCSLVVGAAAVFFFFSYYYSYICRKCEKNFLAGFPIPNKFYCIFFQIQQESEINTHHQVSLMVKNKKKDTFVPKCYFNFLAQLFTKSAKLSWNQSIYSHLIFGVTKSHSANFRKSFVTFNDTLQDIGCVIKDTIFPFT